MAAPRARFRSPRLKARQAQLRWRRDRTSGLDALAHEGPACLQPVCSRGRASHRLLSSGCAGRFEETENLTVRQVSRKSRRTMERYGHGKQLKTGRLSSRLSLHTPGQLEVVSLHKSPLVAQVASHCTSCLSATALGIPAGQRWLSCGPREHALPGCTAQALHRPWARRLGSCFPDRDSDGRSAGLLAQVRQQRSTGGRARGFSFCGRRYYECNNMMGRFRRFY